MNRVQLSARAWRTEQDVHDALARALQFPGYYGRNLDALFDCLRELTDTQLVIEDCAFAAEHIERWGKFLMVFFDSAMENPGLQIRLLAGNGDYGD